MTKYKAPKLSFKNKLLVSFSLFCLIPLVLIISLAFFWTSHTLKSQKLDSYQSMLNTACLQMDEVIDGLNSYALELSQRPWVKSMAYLRDPAKSRYDHVDYQNFADEITYFPGSNPLVDDVFLVFFENEQIISSVEKGISSFEWFSNESFENTYFADEKSFLQFSNISEPYFLPLEVENYGRTKQGILYTFPIIKSGNRTICNVCFYLEWNKIDEFLTSATDSEQNPIIVICDNHVVINNSSIPDETVLSHLLEKNSTEVPYGQDHFWVLESVSSITDCMFYSVVSQNSVYQELHTAQIILILLTLLLSAVGFWLSYSAAIKNYRPIADLINSLKQNIDIGIDNNYEFDWIKQVFDSLLDREHNLDEQIENYRPELQNVCLQWLLTNIPGTDSEHVKSLIKSLHIELPFRNFICIISTTMIYDILRPLFQNLTTLHHIKCYGLENGREYIWILNYMDDSELHAWMEELSLAARQRIADCNFGVGEPCFDIINISRSYKQAKLALDYRNIHAPECMTFFKDVTVCNKCYFYPLEQEEQIRNKLKSGNLDAAMQIVDGLIQENTQNTTISFSSIRNLFINLKFTALKCLDELSNQENTWKDNISMESYDNLPELRESLRTLYEFVCTLTAQPQKQGTPISDSIFSYIDHNITDSTLSLASVAAHFSLSPSYISKLFKEKSNTNFLDYINQARIRKAKELLLTSKQLSIQAISKEIGYDNDTTFRRVFKKQEGITPTQYRSIHQNVHTPHKKCSMTAGEGASLPQE